MSPRPNQGRTIGAEDRMRANIVRLLAEQERSAAWLGRKLVVAGAMSDASGVWKSLNSGRAIYVDEAVVIAETLGVSLADLTRP